MDFYPFYLGMFRILVRLAQFFFTTYKTITEKAFIILRPIFASFMNLHIDVY